MNSQAEALVIGAALALAGALFTAVVNAVVNALNARSARKSEERKHYRELVINAAIENWKYRNELLLKTKMLSTFYPLDAYILRMVKFSDMFLAEKTDLSNIEEKLNELDRFEDRVEAQLRKRQAEERARQLGEAKG